MEAASRGGFDLVEHVLAIAERQEDRRDSTDLHAHIANTEHDVCDSAELVENRADVLGTRRRFDLHQLFSCEDERRFVGKAASPVDPVDQRRDLRVRANLSELLVAAVHVTHDGFGNNNLLTIELRDDTKRAVCRRVLRADVEGHTLGLDLDVYAGIGRLL